MPPYATSNTLGTTPNPVAPAGLYPGDQIYLFGTSVPAGSPPTPGIQQPANDSNVNFEAVTVNERSIAVQLVPRLSGGVAGCIVEVRANANPGAAEIDIQDAATDADGLYITQTTSTAYKITAWTQIGVTGIYFATAQFQPEGGRFISLKCTANPNAVAFTAKLAYV